MLKIILWIIVVILLLIIVNQSNKVKSLEKENKVLKRMLRNTDYSYVVDQIEKDE
ncbi:hypothetical protein M4I17_09795 [Enterococcus thailandicus]|uniref:hypothetical protein n=1 Tax=Enterococcus thailandicus TaxID=417368 RepID=UPI00254368C3|nr:hypothetical protein [Enterococcus thailandicus]MDK4352690.1 hypothetical protein [Enterococcus thailandicus]MDT2735486.1 hypothetical protein [Enterococcus thailandicus]